MISSVGQLNSGSRVSAMMHQSGGIQAIEQRIQALEARMAAISKKVNAATKPDFKSTLQSAASAQPAQQAPSAAYVKPAKTLKGKAEIKALIKKYSTQYKVDEALVNAVVRQESGFNPNAVSHAGAQGLMQLMPATAKGLGVVNPLNPEQNIAGGVKHLRGLLDRYRGNIPLALAAYNAGGGAVDKYDGIPPYKETQNYVKSILAHYLKAKQV